MEISNMFTILRELCINEINTKYTELMEEIKTPEGFNKVSRRYGKTYTKNPEKKLTKFLEGRKSKEIEEIDNQIKSVESAPDFKNDFIITIEWVRSQTWGHNPTVYTNTGYTHKGISGCGYDKQSTATGYALSDNLSILKLLYQKKEEELNKVISSGDSTTDFKNVINRTKLGYGSGYGILPHFEGGVGVSSHERILNNIGLTLNHVSNTKSTDVYIIKKQNYER
jgi:hypothetical protein